MRVALCKVQQYKIFKNRPQANEPVSLVGMYNSLRRFGHDPIIIDSGLQPWQESINNFDPQVVGITAPAKRYLDEIMPFVQVLKSGGVKVILGGVFATANPEFYAKALNPHAVVLGQGEPVIRDLFKSDYNPARSKKSEFYQGNIGETSIFRADKLLSLNEISYSRPYFLKYYDGVGWPTTMYGCLYECIFCTSDGRASFMAPERALSEIEYLVRALGADTIFPMGGDFTAKPSQATEIVKGIIDNLDLLDVGYDFNARIDTLAKSIRRDPGAWKKLFKSTNVLFMPGIETFSPSKLMRLEKYRRIEQAKKHHQYLIEILEFIKGTKAMISGNFIMHDPETGPEEFYNDIFFIRQLLAEYPEHFAISDGEIFNHLMPVDGTKANAMYKAEGDDFFYPKEMSPFAITMTLYFFLARYPATQVFDGEHSVQKQSDTTIRHLKLLMEGVKRIMRFVEEEPFTSQKAVQFARDLVEEQFPGEDR